MPEPGPEGTNVDTVPAPDVTTTADGIPTPTRDVMPVWVPRAIALLVGGLAALLTARWLLGRLRSFLLIIAVSLFLSFALEPAVNWLARKGIKRGLATGLVLFGGLFSLLAFMVILGSALFTQVSEFADDLPERIERIEQSINQRFDTKLDADALIEDIEQGNVQGLATNLAGNALSLGISAVGFLFNLFTIGLFTFYMVAEGPRFRRTVLSFLPTDRQEQVAEGWELAIDKTGGYIYSRGLLALISSVVTTVALLALGVDYALALGVWVGLVSQFIPTVGTYLAGALPVLIALLDDPIDALVVLVFIAVYQQVENYLFAPKITARTMDIHPAVAFGTVIVGAALLGGVGALLALPAAAVLQAIGSTYFDRHEVIETEITREDEPVSTRRFFRKLAGRS